MSSSSSSTTARLSTTQTFLSAFATLSSPSIRTPNCIQTFAPSSVNPPSPKTNADFTSHMSSLHQILSAFPVTPIEIIDNPSANMVTVWARSEAVFREELKDEGLSQEEWRYCGEYVFMIWFEEGGKRIDRIVEFLDSKGTERFRGLVGRAKGNLRKYRGDADEGPGF